MFKAFFPLSAFVDPEEWARYCDRTIATFEAMVARGQ